MADGNPAARLSDVQMQAVRAPSPLMIISTAGSGKSTVLTHRMAAMLRANPDERVCGVSFTAESARHLAERAGRLAPDCKDRMIFGTFHSLAMRMLKAAGRKVEVAHEGRQAEFLSAAFSETQAKHPEIKFDAFLAFVEQTKRCLDPLLEPEQINPYVGAYGRYQKMLERQGLMDFSDLLLEAIRGMQCGTVAPIPCTSMLIDEVQDTDECQFEFIMAHKRCGVRLTIVGDDDQAIYTWRGAMAVEVFHRFKEETHAGQVNLTTTFRCPKEIFTPAARLITRNRERMPKELSSALREEGRVRVQRAASSKDEADMVVSAIIRSGKPGHWGVLSRTNEQLDAIETRLKLNGIEYTRAKSKSFWAHPPAALILGICSDLTQGTFRGFEELLRRMGVSHERINSLHSQIKAKQPGALRRFADLAEKQSTDPVNVVARRAKDWMRMLNVQGASATAKMKASDDVVRALRTFVRSKDVKGPGGKPRSKAMDEYENKMFDAAVNAMLGEHRFMERSMGGASTERDDSRKKPTTLADRVRSTMFEGKEKEGEEKQPGVQLMTLHASKGLEFPYCWIIGCEKDLLPFKGSPLEEERRLMFVGMTRASVELVMSYSIEGERAASPFLEEAGVL